MIPVLIKTRRDFLRAMVLRKKKKTTNAFPQNSRLGELGRDGRLLEDCRNYPLRAEAVSSYASIFAPPTPAKYLATEKKIKQLNFAKVLFLILKIS